METACNTADPRDFTVGAQGERKPSAQPLVAPVRIIQV